MDRGVAGLARLEWLVLCWVSLREWRVAGAVWGTLDRSVDGVNVIWLMAATLFVPWLLFLFGLLAWLLRGRVAGYGLLGCCG